MINSNILVMYLCAAITLGVMYATQPIQPVFESELGFSHIQTSLFTTAIMFPLAVASIFYGYILERFSIKKILTAAFLLLGISQLIFASSNSYSIMLNIRGFQGLLIPAALTGIISYISQNTHANSLASAIGYYIGVTIMGGFFGRFLSGFFTDIFGWRFFIYVLGFFMVGIGIYLFNLKENSTQTSYIKPKFSDIIAVLSIKHNLFTFFAVFALFFSFQAILNFIPFEITKIQNEFNGSKIGFIYIGYAIGVLVSFNVKKLVEFLQNSPKAMLSGTIIFLVGLMALSVANFSVIFVAMIVCCLGFFISHSVASAFINTKAVFHKPISNGLYISFYYMGGALGSFLPGFVYKNFGWNTFVFCVSLMVVFALLCIQRLTQNG